MGLDFLDSAQQLDKLHRILNKFRYILIFQLKRVKSQLELHLSAAKPEAVN